MPKIHRLSALQAQKIAAGEVIERPANVVKELLENAIDAGASQISVYIQQGGTSLIRVVDNGCGMSPEDAYLCFEHHATSKLTDVKDLQTLSTFGFRGEALSSIAAVSNVTITTKEVDAQIGIRLLLQSGIVQKEELVPANQGTDISIQDIFYNIPARRKFLKTEETEQRAIVQLFQAMCLDYSTIHFKLYCNDSLFIQCPSAQTLQERITQLWDYTIASTMIPCSTKHLQGNITVNGFASNHHYGRYDRSSIFVFVNKRWVKQQKLTSSILKGYANVLPQGRYPAVCLFITIDQDQVDVNIHPRKEEVQFLHPRIIESTIGQAIKQALEKNVTESIQRPESVTMHQSLQAFAIKQQHSPSAFTPIKTQQEHSVHHQFVPHIPKHNTAVFDQKIIQTLHAPSDAVVNGYTFLGQLKKTYLLLEKEQGLMLVDQHAAHERILYELFSKRSADIATVQLLFPHTVIIKPENIKLLESHLELFTRNGIGLEILGETHAVIHTTPVHLKNQSLDDLVHSVIGWIVDMHTIDKETFIKKINHNLHAQMACKAAVKAGDILSQEQIDQLLKDLQTTENNFSCPHGRPTNWLISTYDIEKKFKRVG